MNTHRVLTIAAGLVLVGSGVAVYEATHWQKAPVTAPAIRAELAGGGSTAREHLARTISEMEHRVAANAGDEHAAVALADALMRQARVTGDTSLPKRAEAVLLASIRQTDGYDARRMLGVVYLSQHRFVEARTAGTAAIARNPRDAWNYGVVGDASIELGDYEQAFAAFDQMARLKPNAGCYARVAYARELQGDLGGALTAMQMATGGTSAHDLEGQAWFHAQLGSLYFQKGALAEARREYEHALYIFPGHPYALNGLARVAGAEGNVEGALEQYRALYQKTPTPEIAAQIGDLLQRSGKPEEARAMWAEAERVERQGWANESPQPAALARLLAERGLKTDEAVALASQAAAERHDIFTEDALAWSLYRAGRLDESWRASQAARRTGTRDRRILYHAAAIAAARGDASEARQLAERALDGHPTFDLIAAPAAEALLDRLKSGSGGAPSPNRRTRS
jgi:tetratricopeptide (TPR) repeat protein